ncbi:MAG: hypothetical protein GTN93_23130, partial [Anaerolineae bacterium]|nr:hypothetical protein [Anaerolineae bacterium]
MTSDSAWFIVAILGWMLTAICFLGWVLAGKEWRKERDWTIHWKGQVAETRDLRDEQQQRIADLETAIKKHMKARGHDRCWLDDVELYRVLNPHFDKMDLGLPALPEFMHNCA